MSIHPRELPAIGDDRNDALLVGSKIDAAAVMRAAIAHALHCKVYDLTDKRFPPRTWRVLIAYSLKQAWRVAKAHQSMRAAIRCRELSVALMTEQERAVVDAKAAVFIVDGIDNRHAWQAARVGAQTRLNALHEVA